MARTRVCSGLLVLRRQWALGRWHPPLRHDPRALCSAPLVQAPRAAAGVPAVLAAAEQPAAPAPRFSGGLRSQLAAAPAGLCRWLSLRAAGALRVLSLRVDTHSTSSAAYSTRPVPELDMSAVQTALSLVLTACSSAVGGALEELALAVFTDAPVALKISGSWFPALPSLTSLSLGSDGPIVVGMSLAAAFPSLAHFCLDGWLAELPLAAALPPFLTSLILGCVSDPEALADMPSQVGRVLECLAGKVLLHAGCSCCFPAPAVGLLAC